MNRQKKTTIYDIAEHLNISTGTVYRALHNTGRISEQTRQRVLETAEKLGYVANHAAQSLRRNPIYIGVILCCPISQYSHTIQQGMEKAFDELAQFNVFPDIREIPDKNAEDCPEEILSILAEFEEKKYNGAVLYLSGSNGFAREHVRRLCENGMSIATVANDISHSGRTMHISADGHAAGMLAAEIFSLFCEDQPVAILTGSLSNAIHKSKVDGFQSFSGNSFSEIRIYEHGDSESLAKKQIHKILSDPSRPHGIYITSAMADSICRDILQHDWHPKIIATDLFEDTQQLLRDGHLCATIFQDPFRQGFLSVSRLYEYISGRADHDDYLIVPQAIFRSNMDAILS